MTANSNSVHKAGCFSTLDLALEVWKFPEDPAVPHLQWKLRNTGSICKGINSSKRTNQLVSTREDLSSQRWDHVSSAKFFLPEVIAQTGWDCPHQSRQLIHSLLKRFQFVSSWHWDQPRTHVTQAVLVFTVYAQMTLNQWSSCLSLLNDVIKSHAHSMQCWGANSVLCAW